MSNLNVVIVKPSKYGRDGFVAVYRWGFMPNSTIPYINSLIPRLIGNTTVNFDCIDGMFIRI